MAEENKGPNKFDELRGKAKEQAGKVTGNREQEAEGKVEQNKAKLKQAGEKVKDAFTSDDKNR
ncbi:CsbD family protein [Nocardiopsis changdeensis]|uniref:CsbD family protein n=1 Tax=Nocardiopsis changdeensis TaxID=2831969 RepID=A0ABX8BUB7_9ACTN|nr:MULTISPECIES: CsbD family protein [Nocardiopsis]QUX25602.1 CsbD family protein [Nocardiopsis changdeensis]QYX35988.1 CsbD family protein [Nocardiopsis sp. MT53]